MLAFPLLATNVPNYQNNFNRQALAAVGKGRPVKSAAADEPAIPISVITSDRIRW
jgi:hypothetical protein